MVVNDYEFPEAPVTEGSYDANWLEVGVSIQTDLGGLRMTEACVLTWELAGLADQLDVLAAPQLHGRWQAELNPLEPYFRLRFVQDETGLFFTATLTAHDTDLIQSHKAQWEIDPAELEAFRQQLAGVMQVFPVRGKAFLAR